MSKFLDTHQLEPKQTVPASRKLSKPDAVAILEGTSRLIVAKGKKVSEWTLKGEPPEDAVVAMLGPTGNLRAPTLRVGRTTLVGFDQDTFEKVLG